MVAVQVLLMNYFLLGLHTDSHYINDVLPRDEMAPCPLGCSICYSVNGCFSCKPPFLLLLQREGFRQTGTCRRECPKGFFGFYKGKSGFCAKCDLRGCLKCSSKTSCIQCRRGRVLYKGRCKKKCPRGSMYNAHFNRCLIPRKDVTLQGSSVSSSNSTNVSFTKPTILDTAFYPKKTLTKEERKTLRENRRRRRRRRKKKRKKKRRRKKKKVEEGIGSGKRIRTRHWKEKKRRKNMFTRVPSLIKKRNSTRVR